MFRRFLLLVITVIAALSLLACDSRVSPTPSGAGETQTAQAYNSARPETSGAEASPKATQQADNDVFYVVDFNGAYTSSGKQQIFETNDSVYYLCCPSPDTSTVYFSDKEYKDWMPLCSKPDCMHTPKDHNCNAHLEGETYTKMWLYGRHIYYCSYDRDNSEISLWRMKLDGSAHEELMLFPKDEAAAFGWYFHNKYLFVYFSSVVGTQAEIRNTAFCVDLSASPLTAEKYELADEGGAHASFGMPVSGMGNKLYCLSNDEQNLLFCVDIAAKTRSTVCRLPANSFPSDIQLYGDVLQICYGWDPGEIITVDIDTGELTVINEAEPQTMKWYRPYRRYIFGSNTANSLNPSLKGTAVYDYYGSIINDIPYESYNTEITISYILGDYVFGHDYYKDGARVMEETPQWYLDIRDIGTENLMWRRWEPEG